MSLEEGLEKAREVNLDLCEIAANAKPPVCKLMDFGKYKYERQKKLRESRTKQNVIRVKEVKLSPHINDHDYQIKLARAVKFLGAGDKVKVTLMFRGRQRAHPEVGKRVLDRFIVDIEGKANVDKAPKLEGRMMTMVLSPPT